MAEVQKTTQSGEMTQQFIEFVMMQAQNAALFLGQIPNPQSGEPEVNLDLARMFIDQLIMIREKTRGNLIADEEKVLANAISNLQLAFFEASQASHAPAGERAPAGGAPKPASEVSEKKPAPEQPAEGGSPLGETRGDEGSKRRFTKSYG